MTTLSGTLPETQAAYGALSAYAASSLGVTLGLADYGAFRTPQDTIDILTFRANEYNAGLASGAIPATESITQFRPIAGYGLSYHDFGAAFDVAIVARPAGQSTDGILAALGAVAPSFGLRWGGTFSNADPVHFELAIPLDDAANAYAQMLGDGASTPTLFLGVAVAAVVVWALHRNYRGRHE